MKKSKLLLTSAILTTIYFIFILKHFFGGFLSSSNSTEFLAYGIASLFVTPHILFVGLGVLFNWIGFFMNLRWAALVSGILYTVAIFLMIIYAIALILQIVFCFVAFARMKKADTN